MPEGQFQWFIDIVAYLQLVTGETVRLRESQIDKTHTTKVRKTKEKSIIISSF